MSYASFVLKHLDVKTRSGMEWQCLCPYHEDSSPSFSINVRKGLFVCYACGAKGNMKDLSKHLNVNGPRETPSTIEEVEEKLAELSKPVDGIKKRVDASFWTSRYQIGLYWMDEWAKRLPIMMGRTEHEKFGLDSKRDLFALGYDNIKHELIIPIFDFNGSAESCVRRRLGDFDGPKYLYSKGFKTSHHLYGAWQVKMDSGVGRPKHVAIVEGTIDALAMWEVGIPAVALLGSNLSATQKKLLMALDAKSYVVMTDNDTAGKKARWQIENELSRTHCSVSHPTIWTAGKKDVAEMSCYDRSVAFHSAEPYSFKY